MEYLYTFIPASILKKFYFVHGNVLNVLKDNRGVSKLDFSYTTLIMNSINDLITILANRELYNSMSTTFLLRNHSGNTEIYTEYDKTLNKEIYKFREKYDREILERIVDLEAGIPLTENRFGRFEPMLFKDANPTGETFYFGK
jgi:hypothetical protein